jgi:hypothetical protein
MDSNCTATIRVVESIVNCEEAACSVHKILYLESGGVGPTLWNKEAGISYFDSLENVLMLMLGADIKCDTTESEQVERRMANPYIPLETPYWEKSFYQINLVGLPAGVFGLRLQLAMNTFWDSTVGSTLRVGNLTSKDLAEQNETNTRWWTPVNATGERYVGEKYICNIIFAILTIVISWLLFAAASVSVVLGIVTRAPDGLGSYLDGLEATRALRDVRVMIDDVQQEADVGHVAFASMNIGPGRVSKKRLYN